MSLPSRERGLKFNNLPNCVLCEVVAPLAGAWIEICEQIADLNEYSVAPLAGAWIEIELSETEKNYLLVAPLAGAWIEIRYV